MAVTFRALTYVTIFFGLLLVYLPARLLTRAGIPSPPAWQTPQIVGIAFATAGALLAAWCVGAFIALGKGTPAPFDPPRRLVVRGPYRFVRNPMYIGGVLALGGAALVYESVSLAFYAALFLLAAHLFVMFYEEPTLRRSFGPEYEAYCRHVRRWRPGKRAAD